MYPASSRTDLCPEWGAMPWHRRLRLPPSTLTIYRSAVLSLNRQSDSPKSKRTEWLKVGKPQNMHCTCVCSLWVLRPCGFQSRSDYQGHTSLWRARVGQQRYKIARSLTTKHQAELMGTEVPENFYSWVGSSVKITLRNELLNSLLTPLAVLLAMPCASTKKPPTFFNRSNDRESTST